MTDKEKDRIKSAIRHIKSSVDVDTWAMEIAVNAMLRMLDVDGDLVSRQAAIDVIDSYEVNAPDYMQAWAVKLIEAIKGDVRGLISDLPSAHPETHEERTETHGVCLDLISRQKALDAIMSIWGYADEMYKALSEVPSVQTEPKTGHWIPQDFNDSDGMIATAVYYFPKCSECGHAGSFDMNYCSNCGAYMKEEENG